MSLFFVKLYLIKIISVFVIVLKSERDKNPGKEKIIITARRRLKNQLLHFSNLVRGKEEKHDTLCPRMIVSNNKMS